ncbi:MAG: hypothetical protein AAGD01_11815 [Acidobacteriota bacterium]
MADDAYEALDANSRVLVDHLVYERFAAALRSAQTSADEDLAVALERANRAARELEDTKAIWREQEKDLEGLQQQLDDVNQERAELLEQLASSDRRLAAEIEEYRRQVASIAGSPDPRKRGALRWYAAGDRERGFSALVDIQRAETRAVAAGWREIGALALERLDRQEMDTVEVIPIFEESQRLDPEHSLGWIELARLYQGTGRLDQAQMAAEQALEHAQGVREQSVALTEVGNLAQEAGDLESAARRFHKALELDLDLVEVSPQSASAQRDLSVSYNKLGDVERESRNLSGARDQYLSSLRIAQRLASSNPGSAEAQRDLSVSLNRLGALESLAGNLEKARKYFEADLETVRELAEESPTSVQLQLDLVSSFLQLGRITNDPQLWKQAHAIALQLKEQGKLSPRNQRLPELIQEFIAAQEAGQADP